MNIFKKWFSEVVEILKTVSYEPAYHWVKGRNVRKKEYTAIFKLFFYWKMTNNFTRVSHSVRCLCLFSTQNIWHSGNSGWKRQATLMSSLGINRDRCFVLWSFRRTLPHTDKVFSKGIITSIVRFDSVEHSSPKPHQNLQKVTVARYEFGIKHCLTLKINQLIFIKHVEKTNPYPDKIHVFSYLFEFKSIFKYSGRVYLASARRWRTQWVEMPVC